ncbi:hypothetical protein PY650_35330 [Rhizobium calliandrae]|uniref:Uncharacterized protein n=1 Tax=Rhizobium calliandrae TaxID=1312182 RepID=A0ABT7KQ81_9HYPH|nr:hypothetical protein [Rhizobium calliandrae]MDL2410737.1 hypothetical protein [Rhizobium calliandrae]
MHARLGELTRYWIGLAHDIPGFTLHTPIATNELSAISLLSIDGIDMRKLESELREKYCVHVIYRKVKETGIKGDLDIFVSAVRDALANSAMPSTLQKQ